MTRCEIAATGNILGVLDRCWSRFPGCCFKSSSQAVLLPGPWWLHRDQLTCGWLVLGGPSEAHLRPGRL